jgi:hypothetical protein
MQFRPLHIRSGFLAFRPPVERGTRRGNLFNSKKQTK